ncbi:uncharacterized protein LOC108598202 [Drosophila busckii]|uniref:uncharacterized protein LOC108598202 n=1 Tax=Drosophila busckii TaxID=30019 RepID=UPI0014331B4E|nr:uncharacterized protein LOC108598202 [Drosophila busckii]
MVSGKTRSVSRIRNFLCTVYCTLTLFWAVAALLLLQAEGLQAKRRKHKGEDHAHKTKTKWSSSSDFGAGSNTQVATEEHGYYVKRTYSPAKGAEGKRSCPPYLAIPIAWFSCADKANCQQFGNSAAINSPALALSEGYLCDDDCSEGYEPICGQTPNEVAVFYNKCKLNVAKCRTHGLWTELPYAQCQQTYPKETAYTDKKFKSSPYYSDKATAADKQKPDKEQSAESSEEKQKVEKVEPIVLPLPSKPMEIPVPAIALPPMPMKTGVAHIKQVKPVPTPTPTVAPMPMQALPALLAGGVSKIPVVAAAPIPMQTEKADKDKLKYATA